MFDEVDDTIKRTRNELIKLLVQIGLLSFVEHFAIQTIFVKCDEWWWLPEKTHTQKSKQITIIANI